MSRKPSKAVALYRPESSAGTSMVSNDNPIKAGANFGSDDRSKCINIASKDIVIWDEKIQGLGQRYRPNCEPTWVYQWRGQGRSNKRHLGSICTMTREQARVAAAQKRAEVLMKSERVSIKSGTAFQEFTKTFLDDCRNRWKPSTFKSHEYQSKSALIKYLGDKPIESISLSDIEQWRKTPHGHCSRALSILSSTLTYAEDLELRPYGTNPCIGLRRKKSSFSANYPQQSDYQIIGKRLRLEFGAEPVVVMLLLFLILTGARRGEAINLRWNEIDGCRANLRESKTGRRTIWLPRPARNILEKLPRRLPSDAVFFLESGISIDWQLTRLWSRVRDDLDSEATRVHDMRHGFASVGVTHGEELRVVGDLLGHCDLKTTQGYAHLCEQPIAEAAQRVSKRIDNLLKGRPENPVPRLPQQRSSRNETEAYRALERFMLRRLPTRSK